jgi:aldose sugar dehydrogenase
MRALTIAVLGLGAAVILGVAASARQPQAGPQEVVVKYMTLCSNCHGAQLAGGQAPSLLDDQWTFGGDDASLAHSIREGRPGTQMMAFKAALSEAQIRALVIYIREEAARARTRSPAAKPNPNPTVQSERHAFKVEDVAEGLSTPWGMAFLPDGRLLVTERVGRLRIIEHGTLAPQPIADTPAVWVKQDAGMLDVAVHPKYAENGWIYLAYCKPGALGTSQTAVVRGRIRDGRWVDQQYLYEPTPESYVADNTHFGLRFLFDKAGHVFYSIGDRGKETDAQELSNPNGKIHRVMDDGRVPPDNPFVGRAGAIGSIWTYGNRNPQGLAWHPVTGELWATEHGPRGGDELNLIEPGRNYGWPVITYGMNYDGTPVSAKTEAPGMEQPLVQWTPSIATSDIEFYTGDKFPNWKNDLFVTALAFQELRRLVVDGRNVVHQELLFKGIGRVRDIVTGPDGYLYVALNDPGRIVRLVPANGTR